jgi:iron(III) transport system permease protein
LVDAVWVPVVNSGSAGQRRGGAGLLAAIPVAVLAVRFPSPLGAIVERITYASFALPGIVVALVFFGADYAHFIYQTIALLATLEQRYGILSHGYWETLR